MIRVISKDETSFVEYSNPELYDLDLGEGVLIPTQCEIGETAGAEYSLTLTHPIDPAGKWKLLEPFSLICAPVPRTETPAISPDTEGLIGVGSKVYTVNSGGANLYGKRGAYRAWISGEGYYPGDRVSHNSHNWECTGPTYAEPGSAGASWRDLGSLRYVIRALTAGTQVILTRDEGTDSTYYYVILLDGTEGQVRKTSATYAYTIEEGSPILDDLEPRVLTHQLFRVTDISIDGAAMTVRVTAQHISYDWSMALVGQLSLSDTALSTAIAAIRSACLPDGATSAPMIYAEPSEATVTLAATRKTVTSILLDPETGAVRQARARLVRDERDFFLLSDAETDRGMVIRYGVNLRGVTWRRDYTKLVTRVMPIAKNSSGGEYLLPEVYVDSPLRGRYPVDCYQALTVDAQVGKGGATEADVQQKMREEAGKVFSEKEADLPATTLTVDFLLLGDTEEFAQYRGLEQLRLYDTVEIEHPDIGLSTRAQVKGYKWDAITGRYTQITLGDAFAPVAHTVYGYSVANGTLGAEKLSPEAIAEIRNG